MKIAILGSGGREHALTVSISKSSKSRKNLLYTRECWYLGNCYKH